LPPDGGASDSECVIGTQRETSSIDGTSLRWVIELELVVRGNVAGAASLILQDTSSKSEGEDAIFLTLRDD
jgi:hypothetical protein